MTREEMTTAPRPTPINKPGCRRLSRDQLRDFSFQMLEIGTALMCHVEQCKHAIDQCGARSDQSVEISGLVHQVNSLAEQVSGVVDVTRSHGQHAAPGVV